MINKNANVLIGERVREARLARGLNQDVLGAAIGLKKMAMSKKESGENVFTAAQLFYIAKYLKKPVKWFLEDL